MEDIGMYRGTIVLFTAAIAFVTFTPGRLTAAVTPKPAPAITLPDASGARVQLSEFKGKVVLVDFWASWCVSCKTSFPALDSLYKEFQPRGFEVLAVNVDEKRRDADAFLSARPNHLRVLFDPKGASAQAFNVQGMPTSFLIDKAGDIRFTHVGYSGDVAVQYKSEIAQLLLEK